MVHMTLKQLQTAAKAHNTATCITKVSTKSKSALAKNLGVTLTKAPKKPAAKKPAAKKAGAKGKVANAGPKRFTAAQRARALAEMSGPVGVRLSKPGGRKTRKDKGTKRSRPAFGPLTYMDTPE